MDVLLLHLPAPLKEEICDHAALGYMASLLREKGFCVKVMDGFLQQLEFDDVVQQICDDFYRYQFSLLGISAYQYNFSDLIYVVECLRRSGVKAHITIGGHFPTMAPELILRNVSCVDSICLGESEYAILALANSLKKQKNWFGIPNLAYRDSHSEVVITAIKPQKSLNKLPYPARDSIQWLRKLGGSIGIVNSRGCWGSCRFCSISSFYKAAGCTPYRTRDPKDVVDEIESTYKKYGYRRFRFLDDVFLLNSNKSRQNTRFFANELIKRKLDIEFWFLTRCDTVERDLFELLKIAGLKWVYLGLESWSDKSLKRLNKKIVAQTNQNACKILDEIGIDFRVGFVMFEPYSTLYDIYLNMKGLRDFLQKGCLLYSPENLYRRLYLFWGTPLVDILERDDLLITKSIHRLEYRFKHVETQNFYEIICLWRSYLSETRHLYGQLRTLSLRPSITKPLFNWIVQKNMAWAIFQFECFTTLIENALHNSSIEHLKTTICQMQKDKKSYIDHLKCNALSLIKRIFQETDEKKRQK